MGEVGWFLQVEVGSEINGMRIFDEDHTSVDFGCVPFVPYHIVVLKMPNLVASYAWLHLR